MIKQKLNKELTKEFEEKTYDCFCSDCDMEVEPEANYCSYCGEPL